MTEITAERLMEEADHLFAFALQRVNDLQHAEDLVQESLIIAWRKRDSFHGRSSLRTWLFGIMKFKVLDYHRLSGRTPTQRSNVSSDCESHDHNPLDQLFNARGAWKVDPAYGLEILNESPDEISHRTDVMKWISQCMERLPDRLRLLFILREVDGLPVSDAASAADVTPGSAAVLLTRARHQLRACLQQHGIQP